MTNDVCCFEISSLISEIFVFFKLSMCMCMWITSDTQAMATILLPGLANKKN